MLNITYISHSAFILSDGAHTLAIDPFITGNPTAKITANDVHPNFIFVTHAHGDHLGDTIALAKANNSQVICVNELATWLSSQGVNAHPMHIGGSFKFPFGSIKITIAHHGSKADNGEYMGEPCGVIIKMGDKTVYHTGDTGLFLDMKLIGQLNKPDVMLVPIGDNFTMGIDDATTAVDFVRPELAIPMHFNTFPIIPADPKEFVAKVEKIGCKAKALDYSETISL
ncbi:MAG: metal-dependent hydrolase [Ignavibacteria bacterium]|jgi:L-ascorbate metabolism protein UlaG (beta-lactamase superfamily)|nr:metal-dependent hydrolase [Ignavibacteria bacterium]